MPNVAIAAVLVGALATLILLFLIFRAIVLWYWRVNEQIELLASIDEKLGRLVDKEPYV